MKIHILTAHIGSGEYYTKQLVRAYTHADEAKTICDHCNETIQDLEKLMNSLWKVYRKKIKQWEESNLTPSHGPPFQKWLDKREHECHIIEQDLLNDPDVQSRITKIKWITEIIPAINAYHIHDFFAEVRFEIEELELQS